MQLTSYSSVERYYPITITACKIESLTGPTISTITYIYDDTGSSNHDATASSANIGLWTQIDVNGETCGFSETLTSVSPVFDYIFLDATSRTISIAPSASPESTFTQQLIVTTTFGDSRSSTATATLQAVIKLRSCETITLTAPVVTSDPVEVDKYGLDSTIVY